ncbi:MAG: hypothetical protein MZV63_40195 [Marinilabiliales bacterium]|nr:hypothetical protein [Marinilabiliales bacterium]
MRAGRFPRNRPAAPRCPRALPSLRQKCRQRRLAAILPARLRRSAGHVLRKTDRPAVRSGSCRSLTRSPGATGRPDTSPRLCCTVWATSWARSR